MNKVKEAIRFFSFLLLFLFIVSPAWADIIFSDSFDGSYPGSWYIGHDGGSGNYAWAWPNGYAHEYSDPAGGQYYYPDDLHVYMERRNVSLDGYTTATFSFYYIVDTEYNWDFFTVNVRDQNGVWYEMFSESGEHELSWVYQEIDLSQFTGQTGLYIQFRFDSDGSISGSPYDGVFVDVVELAASGYTLPDLLPYQPSGWPDKLVVSDTTGTNTDGTIYVNQPAYIDYSVLNDGDADTGSGFYVELWDDTTGDRIRRGYRSSSLSANSYYEQNDSQWTFTSTGWHTIRLKVDADNNVNEGSNEGNNEYNRQVYVNQLNKALRVRVWVISYLLEHGSEDFQTEILLIS